MSAMKNIRLALVSNKETQSITWTRAELDRIGNAEELQIASLRGDGTQRNFVTIWVVRVGDELYIRSVNGRTSAWFRGVETRHEGHIQAGGVQKDVNFVEETNPDINEQIDAAYRTKYNYYPPGVDHINSAAARAATLKLVPG